MWVTFPTFSPLWWIRSAVVLAVVEIYLLYLTTCHKNIVSFPAKFISAKAPVATTGNTAKATNIAAQSLPKEQYVDGTG